MRSLYLARYAFISGLLLLVGGLAWLSVFRKQRK